jgi:hypothetical protein
MLGAILVTHHSAGALRLSSLIAASGCRQALVVARRMTRRAMRRRPGSADVFGPVHLKGQLVARSVEPP